MQASCDDRTRILLELVRFLGDMLEKTRIVDETKVLDPLRDGEEVMRMSSEALDQCGFQEIWC